MVNVYIVSGFLGAGKTTFIKKFLRSLNNGKSVILENEFGETSVDGDFIRDKGYDVVDIPEGCICCNLRVDFTDGIMNILENMNPNNIIIEPTGLGVLSEILKILNGKEFKHRCIIKNIITLVDGENYLEQKEVFGEFFKDQIINAKNVIISKSHKISRDTLEEIVESFEELSVKGNVLSEDLESCEDEFFKSFIDCKEEELKNFENSILGEHSKEGQREIENFTSIAFEVKKKYSREELYKKLSILKQYDIGNIFRAKGIVKAKTNTESMSQSLEFDYVNGNYEIRESKIEATPKICVIGEKLNKNRIKIIFNPIEINRMKI